MSAPVIAQLHRPITFSIVLEWDNAKLSEMARARRALERLGEQIRALHPARFELRQLVAAFDRHALEPAQVREMILPPLGGAVSEAKLVLLGTDGLIYYQL